MMKVYDMVTCSLSAPAEDARDQALTGAQHAASPYTVELGLQLPEALPKQHSALHPALRHVDIEAFLATIDR